ncbi:uncharacterized protein LOC131887201 [Tigriopus californicus]|uniref:uncharacterized protein LOC131887201 n=1 Tax=Tigriopus californicus TaxID=6832 RepID=UPI0027DA9733|nr:uncharacterized protein LOC131887201 [Tigriopus californicus]
MPQTCEWVGTLSLKPWIPLRGERHWKRKSSEANAINCACVGGGYLDFMISSSGSTVRVKSRKHFHLQGRCQGSNPKSEPLASSFFEMYEAFCFHLHLFEVSRQQQQQQQHRTGEMKKDLSLPMFEYIRPEKQLVFGSDCVEMYVNMDAFKLQNSPSTNYYYLVPLDL